MYTTMKAMFGGAFALLLLNVVAAMLFSTLGFRFAGLVQVTLLLTGGFALIGAAFALFRGLRNATAV